MQSEPVLLWQHSYAVDERTVVMLRELTGQDEMELAGIDTRAALDLLSRLVEVDLPDTQMPLVIEKLAASDRDALLAAVHRQCWGDEITSTLTCAACAQRFDLSFTLSDLQQELVTQSIPADPLPVGWRLPNARDEIASAQEETVVQAAQKLAAVSGVEAEQIEVATPLFEKFAPLLDVDLDATCPECGHQQQAHFDVQSFVLMRLFSERDLLISQIHLMARAYGWSINSILELPRSIRLQFAQRLADGFDA